MAIDQDNPMKYLTPPSMLFWSVRFLMLALAMTQFGSLERQLSAQDKDAKPDLELPKTDDGVPGAGPIRRYDWFKNLWNEKRGQWAKRVTADQKSLVFLGDSITQGWGDDFGGSFPGVKLANRGISGDTTRGMLIRLSGDVLALNPTGIVMLMGTNDLEEGAEPETIASNVKLILAAIKKHDPKLPVILCQVFPSSESQKRPADKIQQINKRYAEVVKGDSQVTLVETWPLFANEKGDAKEVEFPDLLHPNKAGYDKWAAAIRPILATLDYLETADDDFVPEPGSISLFNGKDFTGWGFRDQQTMESKGTFEGKQTTSDGRYIAKHGRVVVSTPPEGHRVQQLWTTREFGKNFVLKLEFRATPNADSGVFIRKPQLQCRDYPLAGPYKTLKKYKPQDWNEMVVTVKDNVAHCTCNGEVLEEALKIPPSGPIGLEGDSGQMEYRRIRLIEQP
jgi:lysophospholipase L1-like esterase